MPLCPLLASICCKAIIIDSLLFMVNSDVAIVSEITFPEPIIDYVSDEFLYLCTRNALYKIDPWDAALVDKTPLPLRFNHLLLKDQEIILIATDEIIIIDRNNLAFKSGIGIEFGDYRPITKDQSFASSLANSNIYLVCDAGQRSHLRVIDLRSGRLIRTAGTDRLKSLVHDAKTQSFIGLDIKNNLLTYDTGMNRIRKIKLPVEATDCSTHSDGLLIHSDQCIFLVNPKGDIIDFQPVPVVRAYAGSLVLTDNTIICLDNMTLRPNGRMNNRHNIIQLYSGVHPDQVVGIDAMNNFYILDQNPLAILPMKKNLIQLTTRPQVVAISDSLWYLQLGAFSDRINALHMSKELREQGLPVFVDSTDLYRIKFGGFVDKFEAFSIVESMNIEGWFVYQRRVPNSRLEKFYVGTERYVIEDGVVRKE